MSKQIITINARKFDNSVNRSWNCELISQTGSLLTLVGIFDQEVNHPDLNVIRRGTISYEFYWTDRWYNIFRFHEPEGALKNFYCNINQPPTLTADTLDYIDLDVDILVNPDRSYKILDLEEFAANSIKYAYPPEILEQVRLSTAEIFDLIEHRQFPFDFNA